MDPHMVHRTFDIKANYKFLMSPPKEKQKTYNIYIYIYLGISECLGTASNPRKKVVQTIE